MDTENRLPTGKRMASDAPPAAMDIIAVSYRYGSRQALDNVELSIPSGEIFALLGPNGSGKTTLFRLLSTLIPLQDGQVRIFGQDVRTNTRRLRSKLGVVFQAPSVDRKLTVIENLRHQGHLYGLSGAVLRQRADELLQRLGVAPRRDDLVEQLSGGLRRRVELAKCMLHRPQLLLMDEPATGLDPAARSDLWQYLRGARQRDGVTIVLTTHLLEEADRADRIGILHQGRMVALDTPLALRAEVGGDSILLETAAPEELAASIEARFSTPATVIAGRVRLEQPDGHLWVSRLMEAFGERIDSVTLGKPTLEDVFIDRTGHQFWENADEAS